MGRPLKDETGNRFGSWLVLSRMSNRGTSAAWLVRCGCGTEKVVLGGTLRSGVSQRCGSCSSKRSNRTHGMSETRAYSIWCGIVKRTENPACAAYKNYGGRGIRMCKRWRESFEKFYVDMGEPPPGKLLERKRNNGPYSKANCIWATREDQARNKRNNILITHKGKTKLACDWADQLGIPRPTVYDRIRAGHTDSTRILHRGKLHAEF